jgi:hypothetical protein
MTVISKKESEKEKRKENPYERRGQRLFFANTNKLMS